MSGVWDYPAPQDPAPVIPPRDEDEILLEIRDRRLEEAYGRDN